MHQACPGTTISLTTSADVVEDPAERLRLIAAWTVLPDLVTANQGEEGILEVCELLVSRGVGIEAGLLSLADARQFVAADIAGRCVRAMVEPLDADPFDAVAHAEAIENTLHEAGVALEQVHHGDGIASWAVNKRAIARGHGIRTGLEDTPVLPDGQQSGKQRPGCRGGSHAAPTACHELRRCRTARASQTSISTHLGDSISGSHQSWTDPSRRRFTGRYFGSYGYRAAAFSSNVTPRPGW